jgi:hypothetical protein
MLAAAGFKALRSWLTTRKSWITWDYRGKLGLANFCDYVTRAFREKLTPESYWITLQHVVVN